MGNKGQVTVFLCLVLLSLLILGLTSVEMVRVSMGGARAAEAADGAAQESRRRTTEDCLMNIICWLLTGILVDRGKERWRRWQKITLNIHLTGVMTMIWR